MILDIENKKNYIAKAGECIIENNNTQSKSRLYAKIRSAYAGIGKIGGYSM